MNELSAPIRPRKQPSGFNGQQPRRPRAPASRESRFIGYVVLGFGLLAVIAVLILAFSGPDADLDVAIPDAQKVETLAADIKPQQPIAQTQSPKPAEKPRTPPGELSYRRQASVTPEQIAGSWQAMIGKYTAVVQIEKGAYQIVLGSPDPQAARIYSSGTYRIIDDIVMLTPRMDWLPPASAPGTMVGYEKLTRAPFSVVVAFQQGRMLWQNAPQTETRVITSPRSPLFMNEKVDYVVWQKLNR